MSKSTHQNSLNLYSYSTCAHQCEYPFTTRVWVLAQNGYEYLFNECSSTVCSMYHCENIIKSRTASSISEHIEATGCFVYDPETPHWGSLKVQRRKAMHRMLWPISQTNRHTPIDTRPKGAGSDLSLLAVKGKYPQDYEEQVGGAEGRADTRGQEERDVRHAGAQDQALTLIAPGAKTRHSTPQKLPPLDNIAYLQAATPVSPQTHDRKRSTLGTARRRLNSRRSCVCRRRQPLGKQ